MNFNGITSVSTKRYAIFSGKVRLRLIFGSNIIMIWICTIATKIIVRFFFMLLSTILLDEFFAKPAGNLTRTRLLLYCLILPDCESHSNWGGFISRLHYLMMSNHILEIFWTTCKNNFEWWIAQAIIGILTRSHQASSKEHWRCNFPCYSTLLSYSCFLYTDRIL